MKIKKFIKKRIREIILVLITAIISSGISVYATRIFKAEEITYSPSNSNWNVNNINTALNDLHRLETIMRTSIKKTLLQSSTLTGLQSKLVYDASGIEGYKNLTVDNFVLEITHIKNHTEGRGEMTDFNADYTLSYNSSTGILSSATSMTGWNSVTNGIESVTYNLYLIK